MAFDKDSKYDKSLDNVFKKVSANPTQKKFFNVEVYSYNGGATKIRIRIAAANSNPEAEANKKWINMGISGLKKEEALALSKLLAEAATAPEL
jgi:hypothetical protein